MVPFSAVRGRHRQRALVLVAALLVALLGPTGVVGAASPTGAAARSVDLQLLAFNDFHGNLEPPSGSSGRITTRRDRQRRRRDVPRDAPRAAARGATRTRSSVSAGDMIGASPLLSAALPRRAHDRGLQRGSASTSTPSATTSSTRAPPSCCACRTAAATRSTAARTATGFAGADFPFLSANVVDKDTARRSSRPTRSRKFEGVQVGFIGMTLKGTPRHRHALGRRRPRLPRRGGDRQPLCDSCGVRTASRRSSCSSTRAASVAARLHQRLRWHVGRRRRHRRAGTTSRSTCSSRATPTGVQLPAPTAGGRHERELVRPPLTESICARPGHRRRHPAQAENIIVTRDVPTDPPRTPSSPSTTRSSPTSRTRSSARSPPTSPDRECGR